MTAFLPVVEKVRLHMRNKAYDLMVEVYDQGVACEDCAYSEVHEDRSDEPGGRSCWLIDHDRDPTQCPGVDQQ